MENTMVNMTNVYEVKDSEGNDRRYEFWFTVRADGSVTATMRGNDKYEQHTETKTLEEVDGFIKENGMKFVKSFRTIFSSF
jgi:hypothetical protein